MGEKKEELLDKIKDAVVKSHAGTCMLMAAIVEDYLERAIRLDLPKLTGKLAKKWFGTYGPISSLAAKIEFAFVLEIIQEEIRGMSRFLLNIAKRSLPRLRLRGVGLASKDAVS
jgi:CRISPR/Cas system-associated protein Csm6